MILSLQQFQDSLSRLAPSTIISFLAETEPQLKKEGNSLYRKVKKLSRVNGIIGGWNYTKAVNNQRAKEDKPVNFQAFPRKWGNRILKSALVEHKGIYYLEVKVQSSNIVKFFNKETGEEIASEHIVPYYRELSKSRQEVDKEIVLRDYALTSIKEIYWAGQTYRIAA